MSTKVNRKNYWWVSFKMRWLVPNYERAVGPAWWIYRMKEWWDYEMDADNCCSKLHHFLEWVHGDLTKWLTPHLKNARKFLRFCVEQNGTKLLDQEANYFYIRTRDEHIYYFTGKTGIFGHTLILKTQWIDKDGNPVNTFMWGIVNGLCRKEGEVIDDVPQQKVETVFAGQILTNKQLDAAIEKITKVKEFGWDWQSIAEDKLVEAVKPKDGWKFIQKIHKSLMKERFPDEEAWYDMDDNKQKEFEKMIINMTPEEAKERAALISDDEVKPLI